MLLLAAALGQKIGAALLILFDPLLGKAAVANFRKDFLHFLARLFCHDARPGRSEEHTSELQSRLHLVCRLLLEKKKKNTSLTHESIFIRLPYISSSLFHTFV